MAKVILSCKCSGAPKYCESSFKSTFPDAPLPTFYLGGKAADLFEFLPNPSEMRKQIEIILKKRGRYGFYYEYDEDGNVLKCWNLLKHKEVR